MSPYIQILATPLPRLYPLSPLFAPSPFGSVYLFLSVFLTNCGVLVISESVNAIPWLAAAAADYNRMASLSECKLIKENVFFYFN